MEFVNAPATYALIVCNTIISLYAFYGDRNFINQFAFHVNAVTRRDEYWRVVTSSFIHANIPHLLMNMMTLFFFGPVVEETLGKLGFLVVYFGAIIVSGIVSVMTNRNNPDYSSVGASDATSGVILSYCCFYPFSSLYFLFLPIPIPAILFAVLFIFMSAHLMGNEGKVIAHEGHLGGAIGGAALTLVMRPEVVTQFFA